MDSQIGPKENYSHNWWREAKEIANMRCKAKHICYITKYGERTLSNIIDVVVFLKLREKIMASKNKRKRFPLCLRFPSGDGVFFLIGRMSTSLQVHHPDDV